MGDGGDTYTQPSRASRVSSRPSETLCLTTGREPLVDGPRVPLHLRFTLRPTGGDHVMQVSLT